MGKHCFPNLDIKDLDGSDVGEHWIARVFSTEKRGTWFAGPSGTAARATRSEPPWHDARRMILHVAPNTQLGRPLCPTNSSPRPRNKNPATRPIPPLSSPSALPIHSSEPSALRHAPIVKPPYKHHVKPSNRCISIIATAFISVFQPKSGANGETAFQVARQTFSSRGSHGIWPIQWCSR